MNKYTEIHPDGQRAYQFVADTAYVRESGTKGEHKAAEYILKEAEQAAAQTGKSVYIQRPCNFPYYALLRTSRAQRKPSLYFLEILLYTSKTTISSFTCDLYLRHFFHNTDQHIASSNIIAAGCINPYRLAISYQN